MRPFPSSPEWFTQFTSEDIEAARNAWRAQVRGDHSADPDYDGSITIKVSIGHVDVDIDGDMLLWGRYVTNVRPI